MGTLSMEHWVVDNAVISLIKVGPQVRLGKELRQSRQHGPALESVGAGGCRLKMHFIAMGTQESRESPPPKSD